MRTEGSDFQYCDHCTDFIASGVVEESLEIGLYVRCGSQSSLRIVCNHYRHPSDDAAHDTLTAKGEWAQSADVTFKHPRCLLKTEEENSERRET